MCPCLNTPLALNSKGMSGKSQVVDMSLALGPMLGLQDFFFLVIKFHGRTL